MPAATSSWCSGPTPHALIRRVGLGRTRRPVRALVRCPQCRSRGRSKEHDSRVGSGVCWPSRSRGSRSRRTRARRPPTSWSSCSTTPGSPTSAATAPTIDTPEHRRARRRRPAVHQLPRHAAVLADAGVAAHRPHRSTPWACARCPTSAPASRTSSGHISNHAATVAEVLRDEGYATFCAGKWHLCPMEQCSAAGPFDQWPLRRGFDRFYGFLEGETDQFHPDLVYDNHPIDPPGGPTTATTSARTSSTSAADDRPTARACGPTARSSPTSRSAPRTPRTRRRPTYLDEVPRRVRRRLGRHAPAVVRAPARPRASSPTGTELAPRNPGVEPWDALPENQQRLAARLQEAFAAFLDHTDDQIGRFVDGLRATRPARQHAADRAGRQRRLARRAARSASCTR